jgi:DegT/DnrJ/EryC1/StrS aminotransferase family
VVFCDVEEPTLTLNPDRVRELIGERTKAIMVCHYAGLVGRLDEIYRIAAEHGLRVIRTPPTRSVPATTAGWSGPPVTWSASASVP